MNPKYRELAIEVVKLLITNRAFTFNQRVAISQGFWVTLCQHPAQAAWGARYPFRFIQDDALWSVGVRLANNFCECHGL
jgi:hypothetical protein